MSTKVQDTDTDGLVDIWESSTSQITRSERPAAAQALGDGGGPPAQGPVRRDRLLVHRRAGDLRRAPTPRNSAFALAVPGRAEAGRRGIQERTGAESRRRTTGINVHFDVGNNYQTDPTNWRPASVHPAGKVWRWADGAFSETACADVEWKPGRVSPGRDRTVPGLSGTVGWKTGFRFYRDDVLKFSPARKNIFRYALFAHALGIPKEEEEFEPDGTTTPNPAFHIPRTNSGVADWAGGGCAGDARRLRRRRRPAGRARRSCRPRR